MKTQCASILLGLIVAASGDARGQQVTMYVPGFYVLSEKVLNPPGAVEAWRFWDGGGSAFNPGKESIQVSVERYFGSEGESVPAQPTTYVLRPNDGQRISGAPDRNGVYFAVVVAPAAAVVTAAVEREYRVSMNCGPDIDNDRDVDLWEGSTPLPVFNALFPAGARVIAGPVDLGSPGAGGDCTTGPQHHGRRRVNVTLFNAGEAETVFVIRAFRMDDWPPDLGPVMEHSVTVGPKRVLQVNDVPVFSSIQERREHLNGRELAWITVEASQPYLTYASSVFVDPDPPTRPFQVFAPRRIQ